MQSEPISIPAAKVRELFYTQKDKTIEFSRKVV